MKVMNLTFCVFTCNEVIISTAAPHAAIVLTMHVRQPLEHQFIFLCVLAQWDSDISQAQGGLISLISMPAHRAPESSCYDDP